MITVSAYKVVCYADPKSNLIWRSEALGTVLVLETDRDKWRWLDGGGGIDSIRRARSVLSMSLVLPVSLGVSSIFPMRQLRLREVTVAQGHGYWIIGLRFELRSIWFLSFSFWLWAPASPLSPCFPSEPPSLCSAVSQREARKG